MRNVFVKGRRKVGLLSENFFAQMFSDTIRSVIESNKVVVNYSHFPLGLLFHYPIVIDRTFFYSRRSYPHFLRLFLSCTWSTKCLTYFLQARWKKAAKMARKKHIHNNEQLGNRGRKVGWISKWFVFSIWTEIAPRCSSSLWLIGLRPRVLSAPCCHHCRKQASDRKVKTPQTLSSTRAY